MVGPLKAFGVKTVITFLPENALKFQRESPLWSHLAVKVLGSNVAIFYTLKENKKYHKGKIAKKSRK